MADRQTKIEQLVSSFLTQEKLVGEQFIAPARSAIGHAGRDESRPYKIYWVAGASPLCVLSDER